MVSITFFHFKDIFVTGYIKLHRGIKDWEWSDDPNVMTLWVHILIRANYKDGRYRGHNIPKGSLVYGHRAFADHTGLSIRQVRTAFLKLKKSKNLTSRVTSKFSIVTVCDWDFYQCDEGEMTSNTSGKRQASDKQVTPSKEGKKGRREEYKEKNTKKRKVEKPDDVNQDVWDDFISQRKTKLTPTALKLIINQAELAGWSLNDAISEAVARGWQSFKADWVNKDKDGNNGKKQNHADRADAALARAQARLEDDNQLSAPELRHIPDLRETT